MAGDITPTQPRPVTGPLPAAQPRPPAGQPPAPPAPGPRPPAARDASSATTPHAPLPTGAVSVDGVELPAVYDQTKAARDTAADVAGVATTASRAAEVAGKAGRALGAMGVLTALTDIGAAFTKTPLDPSAVVGALGELGQNLADAADELSKIPGLQNALRVFGGIGGVITGIMQLKDEVSSMMENGASLSNITGALAGACNLVGGAAMAISPLFPPAAAVGGALMLAGSALNLGKLAIDNWDTITEVGGQAVDAVASGARAVGDAVSNTASRAWSWLTGGDAPQPAAAR